MRYNRSMIYKILSFIHKVFSAKVVYAHCDIPCGIYETHTAETAAQTVAKMTEKIMALALPDWNNSLAVQQYENSMARFVAEKEEEAQKCKDQILILWTDYFKPEHLAIFPGLHETFWRAAKLCSKAKQEVSAENAQALQSAVAEIADIFQKAEAAKKR